MEIIQNPFEKFIALRKLIIENTSFSNLPSQVFLSCLPSLEILENRKARDSTHIRYSGLRALKSLRVDEFTSSSLDGNLSEDLQILWLTSKWEETSAPDNHYMEKFEYLNLKILYLSNLDILNFDAKWLNGLCNLKELIFNACNIGNITFKGLKITFIKLITKLFNNIFKILDIKFDLSLLSFQNNTIKLDNGEFSQMKKLRTLELNNNNEGVNLNKILSGLEHLDEVFINNPKKLTIEQIFVFLSNLSNLRMINLSYCQINELNGRLFANKPNLTHLNLSINYIELKNDSFEYLTKLKELDLSCNRMELLSDFVFTKLGELERLNLEFNRISELGLRGFSGLKKLKWLNLSKNPIKNIELNAFAGLECLETVVLENNYMKKENQEQLMSGYGSCIQFIF